MIGISPLSSNTSSRHPTFSLVIPAYNESNCIAETLALADEYLRRRGDPYEIIVVNDGSVDETLEILKRIQSTRDSIMIVSYEENRGKGYAVREGMKVAKGGYRFFLDADGAFDISLIDVFLKKSLTGFPIVIGSIEVPGSGVQEKSALYRYILGKMAKKFIRASMLPHINDSQRGFKLFTKGAADVVFGQQTLERWGFDVELLVIASVNQIPVAEIPVHVKNFNESSVSLFSYFYTLWEMMRIKNNLRKALYTSRQTLFQPIGNTYNL